MFKKNLIAASVVAVMSAPAFAVVDLDADTGSIAFASELIAPAAAAGTAITDGGTLLSFQVDTGFSVAEGATRFVRFDLTNATLTAAGTATQLDGGQAVSTVATATPSAGGGAGDAYAIYEVSPAGVGDSITPTDHFSFAFSGGLNLLTNANVTVNYALYDNAADAVAGDTANALATETGTLASQSSALSYTATTFSPTDIDVTQGSSVFVGGTAGVAQPDQKLGQVVLANSASTEYTANTSTAATVANVTGATSGVTVTGDFAATQDLTAGVPDGTYTPANVFLEIDGNATPCDSNGADTTIAATTLDGTTAAFTVGTAAGTYDLCANINGITLLTKSTYSAEYAPAAASAAYSVASSTVTVSTLDKNGASSTEHLALTPGGFFSNYLRITNTSSVDGDVFITLIDDAGNVSDQIELGDIAGQTTSELSAGASTSLLDIVAIYNAVTDVDTDFDVAGGKLRVTVEAEFTTVDVQNLSVATDNTYFGQL